MAGGEIEGRRRGSLTVVFLTALIEKAFPLWYPYRVARAAPREIRRRRVLILDNFDLLVFGSCEVSRITRLGAAPLRLLSSNTTDRQPFDNEESS